MAAEDLDDLIFEDKEPSKEYLQGTPDSVDLLSENLLKPKSINESSPRPLDFIPIQEDSQPKHPPESGSIADSIALRNERMDGQLETIPLVSVQSPAISTDAHWSDTSFIDNQVVDNSVPLQDSLTVVEDKDGVLTGQAPQTPTYKINDIFKNRQDVEKNVQKKNKFANECWNCKDTSHAIRDCPEPKNHAQIARSRKEFLSSKGPRQIYKRYHLEESQQYSHIVPGELSEELVDALGLEPDQLPNHIYMMRVLGYPPGWLCEATVSHSGMGLFDGKEAVDTETKNGHNVDDVTLDKYDIKKLIQYPGFNVPPDSGTHDDSGYWRVPEQSNSQSLEVMVERLQGRTVGGYKRKKLSLDPPLDTVTLPSSQCEAKDMDYEETPDGEELPEDNCKFIPPLPDEEVLPSPPPLDNSSSLDDSASLDPNSSQTSIPVSEISLVDLEDQKKQLLAELNDTAPLCSTPQSQVGKVKSVNLGTPIIQSVSPFSTLPSSNKFSVDICDVINFENLPNSTGKYKQMSGLIGKVRTKLAELSDDQ